MTARRPRLLLALLAAIGLVLLTVDYRAERGGLTSWMEHGAVTLFAPLESGAADLVRPLRSVGSGIARLQGAYRENEALRVEVAELRAGQRGVEAMARENSQLRHQVAMRERLGLVTVGARVLAPPPGILDWGVLLDSGARQGLAPGMAVVNGEGLVGRVTDVTAGNVRAELAPSPSAGYAVRLAVTGQDGLLTGHGGGPFQLEVLDPQAQVPPGAQVVTRAFAGSVVPDGIPVGAVVGATPGSRLLPVRPYANFRQLDIVQVVVDAVPLPPPPPAPPGLAPAPGPASPAQPAPSLQRGPAPLTAPPAPAPAAGPAPLAEARAQARPAAPRRASAAARRPAVGRPATGAPEGGVEPWADRVKRYR